MRLFKRGEGKGDRDKPPDDKHDVGKPVVAPIKGVYWKDLGLSAEDVARANQALSKMYGKTVKLNPEKLDVSITRLQMELHSRGFNFLITSHFALQVMFEESQRAYNNVQPEHTWVLALVIEAERRIRLEEGYSEKWLIGPEKVEAKIDEMTKEAEGSKELNRLGKIAASTPQQPRQPEYLEVIRTKLLVEAQHLARMDMARKKHGVAKDGKLPPDALKEFLFVKVPKDVLKEYFEIAKQRYYVLKGLDEKGQPKKR